VQSAASSTRASFAWQSSFLFFFLHSFPTHLLIYVNLAFSLFHDIFYSSYEGFQWQQRKEQYRMHHVFCSFYMIIAFIPQKERKRMISSRIVSFLVNHSNTSHPSSFVTIMNVDVDHSCFS
jgi:hypothetical protein